jgi:hypothetical protein
MDWQRLAFESLPVIMMEGIAFHNKKSLCNIAMWIQNKNLATVTCEISAVLLAIMVVVV